MSALDGNKTHPLSTAYPILRPLGGVALRNSVPAAFQDQGLVCEVWWLCWRLGCRWFAEPWTHGSVGPNVQAAEQAGEVRQQTAAQYLVLAQ